MFPEKAKSRWIRFKWKLVLGKDVNFKKVMSEPNPFLDLVKSETDIEPEDK